MPNPTDAVLQRVTIVASQADSTVLYMRADYAPESASAPRLRSAFDAAGSSVDAHLPPALPVAGGSGGDSDTAVQPYSPTPATALCRSGASEWRNSAAGANRGVALYARTQGNLSGARTTGYVDVHA